MGSHFKSRKKQDNNPSIENNGNNNKSKDEKNENNSESNNNSKNETIKDKEKESNNENSDKNNNTKDNDKNEDNDSDEYDDEDENDEKYKQSNELRRKALEQLKREEQMLEELLDPVKECKNFCKDLIFIKDNKVTVKVNQKFAEEACRNFTIHPKYWSDYPTVKSKNDEIELIDTQTFYPYPSGTCGGSNHRIFVFKANKKGKFKIKFSTHTVKVKVTD